MFNQNSDFLVAKYRNGGFNFNGLIDELAFWNRDLSGAEVATLYNAGTDLATLITPAPEPSTVTLLSVCGLGLLARRRRQRNAAK